MKYTTKNAKETAEVAYQLAKELEASESKRRYIALRGEMGVGKTAFTAGFASYFNITSTKSPTYTVINEYRGNGQRIFHFDMYNISDEDELYAIGYDDYVDSGAYCIVEWSENIEFAIPSDAVFVTILRRENENERDIIIDL
ncbi:MAG: tRNA (adenosine(37)-N6)-threonylcarbamoyltransferase complex ATPase subunit type 1 TsaE [Clostridia bacterium]|nr:tRNA (adenosine(37)-N6)-threonylcarbamoyltransferase complex ATPase subunit type 1 TsaE [Clostridia bacterium]